MNLKTKQTLSVIFSIGGTIGTLVTILLARKAAMREAEIRMTPDQGNLNLMKPIEQIKIIGPTYIPTAIAGLLTIGSIIGSTVMSHTAQASLMSMAVLADQGWRKYKHKVKEILGIDKHSDILKGIANDVTKVIPKRKIEDMSDDCQLYFEENVGYFTANPEKLALAYADLNQRLHVEDFCDGTRHFTNLELFLIQAEADIWDETDPYKLIWGWSTEYLEEKYGYVWVHMSFKEDTMPDGTPYLIIVWGEEPILDTNNMDYFVKTFDSEAKEVFKLSGEIDKIETEDEE